MAQASAQLHESPDALSPETIDRHRAIVSVMEEMEAVDWYDQRLEATSDPELRAILVHNRDEEKEHAAMTLEWLRRHDAKWDENLRKFLFTSGPIVHEEDEDDDHGGGNRAAASAGRGDGSLGIGSLRSTP